MWFYMISVFCCQFAYYYSMQNNRIIQLENMLPYRNNAQNNTSNKRKTKQGDWICVRCGNYNYSFRTQCNRCRVQSKDQNNNAISQLSNQNYGQNSFPSVLFLKLDPLKTKQVTFPTMKQNNQKVEKVEQFYVLKENRWINNLINQ